MNQHWTLPFPCPPLRWMIIHCLHNDVLHFDEVGCHLLKKKKSPAVLLGPAQFRPQQTDCRATSMLHETFMSACSWHALTVRRRWVASLVYATSPPSRVKLSTLKYASLMSHHAAARRSWHGMCLWSVASVCHSLHTTPQSDFTLFKLGNCRPVWGRVYKTELAHDRSYSFVWVCVVKQASPHSGNTPHGSLCP